MTFGAVRNMIFDANSRDATGHQRGVFRARVWQLLQVEALIGSLLSAGTQELCCLCPEQCRT